MKKIAIFQHNLMADFETSLLTHFLNANYGYEIVSFGVLEEVKNKQGLIHKNQLKIDEIVVEDYEALVIPGGYQFTFEEELLNKIREFYDKGKIIGAICAGSILLSKIGILDKHKYTTSLSNWNEMNFNKYGQDPFNRENYIESRVVKDGQIISAKGYAFVDFAGEVIEILGCFDEQKTKKDFLKLYKGDE